MLWIKALTGGVFIGLILWISSTRWHYLAGLLLFFPIISVPTFYFLGREGSGDQLRETILWSFWAIPVWVLFAATLYWASYRFKIGTSISLSLAVWLAAAVLLVAFRRNF